MRSILFAAALAITPTLAAAQADEALVREYAALPAVQQMMAAMMSPEAATAQLEATLPPGLELSDEQLTQIGLIMSEELVDFQPRMEVLMIDAMIESFTNEEVQAMIDFYSSDVGASILLRTQPMFTSIMATMAPELQGRMMARQADIMAIIMQ